MKSKFDNELIFTKANSRITEPILFFFSSSGSLTRDGVELSRIMRNL